MYVITTIIEKDWEPTTSAKVITVYMNCSFTDGTTKLDSDKIRHVLEEVNCSLLLVTVNLTLYRSFNWKDNFK